MKFAKHLFSLLLAAIGLIAAAVLFIVYLAVLIRKCKTVDNPQSE